MCGRHRAAGVILAFGQLECGTGVDNVDYQNYSVDEKKRNMYMTRMSRDVLQMYYR